MASQVRKAAQAPTEAAAVAPFKVRAIQQGYYDHVRRREGDVFIVAAQAFSLKWMEKVGAHTPERITTGQEVLRREHDQLVAERAPGIQFPTESSDNPLDA